MLLTMDVPAMIVELRIQMDIIRRATSACENLFEKIVAIAQSTSTSSKRKSEEIISDIPKKQCLPATPLVSANNSSANGFQPLDLPSLSVPAQHQGFQGS